MFRKIALRLAAVVVLVGTLAAQARAQLEMDRVYPDTLQQQWIESIVRISSEEGQGSGVCVAYNRENGTAVILTAAHVVKNAKRLSFEVFTAASYPNPAATYSPDADWWFNEKDDIAVIFAQMRVPGVASLANDASAVHQGDHVCSLGCGIGAPPAAQVGDIVGLDKSGDYKVNRGAAHGRSGGPLFGQQGVIGIVSRGSDGVTYFVSLEKIQRLMKSIPS